MNHKTNRSQRREVVRPWGSKGSTCRSEKSHRFWIVGKKQCGNADHGKYLGRNG